MKITIVNVVATMDLGREVDLGILIKAANVTYNPSRYACAYIKGPSTYGKVSVFPTGKLISVGTKSLAQAKQDLDYACGVIAAIFGTDNKNNPIRIRNIICVVEMVRPLDLEVIAKNLESAMYEPEQFPGIIWHPKDFEATILLFSSGKAVVSGLKNTISVAELPNYLTKKLQRYFLIG